MVHFHTKNPNLGKFWRALAWKMSEYFGAIWNIVHTLGTTIWTVVKYCGYLVLFSRFGMFEPRKIWQPRVFLHLSV
jgi:hypothetical protein